VQAFIDLCSTFHTLFKKATLGVEESITSIILVLNLVKLAGVALHCLIGKWMASYLAKPI
jgi:hypothetical protein